MLWGDRFPSRRNATICTACRSPGRGGVLGAGVRAWLLFTFDPTYLSVSLHHLRLHGRAAVGRPEPTEHENTGTDRSAGAWGASVSLFSFMYGHAASNQQGPTPLPALLLPGCYSPAWPLCVSRDLERRPPAEANISLSLSGQFSWYVRSPTSSRRARCALRRRASHYLAGVRCTRLVCP